MRNANAAEALSNATQNSSFANYPAILAGFEAKGISPGDIRPRENVFTFAAWIALGRAVRKGEHGVKIHTWIPMTKLDSDGVAQPIGRKPKATTVFHISQTQAIGAPVDSDSDADTGANAELHEGAFGAAPINAQATAMPKTTQEDYFSNEFTPT